MDDAKTYKRTKTTDFFYKVNLAVYLLGLPNFWIRDLKLPPTFVKFYNKFTMFHNTLIPVLIVLELGAFFTQRNLNVKQKTDLFIFSISHPIFCYNHVIMSYRKDEIRNVFYQLTVVLKRAHNDAEVEQQMIQKSMMYFKALLVGCMLSVSSYTIDAGMEVLRKDGTFTTIITAWPDVEDTSPVAEGARVLFYLLWWVLLTRVIGVYFLIISLLTSLSHQHKNLSRYFYQLNHIFESSDLSQREKEDKYEEAFRVGIKLHSDTLRCTNRSQSLCGSVFSVQIIYNMLVLVMLLAQMASSERNLVNLCTTVFTASALLATTGFFMWNSGDVTVEASHLATSMYLSGWHHCRGGSSVRVRRLLVTAMAHAQKPVVLKGLGYIDLSYESYVKIAKFSYTVFSVLY